MAEPTRCSECGRVIRPGVYGSPVVGNPGWRPAYVTKWVNHARFCKRQRQRPDVVTVADDSEPPYEYGEELGNQR